MVSSTLGVEPTSVAEYAGAKVVTVTTALLGRSTLDRNIDVTVSVGGGTASFGTAANDFTVTIPAGKLGGTGTLMLTPTDDEPVVGNEAVKISGTATDFVTIAGATVTITNDGPAFSVAAAKACPGATRGRQTSTSR